MTPRRSTMLLVAISAMRLHSLVSILLLFDSIIFPAKNTGTDVAARYCGSNFVFRLD